MASTPSDIASTESSKDTPRTILENVMQHAHVEQTVKTKRRAPRLRRSLLASKGNVSKSAADVSQSGAEDPKNVGGLDTVTPRTALQGLSANADVLETVAHPRKRAKLVQEEQKQSQVLSVGNTSLASTPSHSFLKRRLSANSSLPAPAVSLEEYQKRLREKFANFKRTEESLLAEKSLEKASIASGLSEKGTPIKAAESSPAQSLALGDVEANGDVTVTSQKSEDALREHQAAGNQNNSLQARLDTSHSSNENSDGLEKDGAMDESVALSISDGSIADDETAADPLNLSDLHNDQAYGTAADTEPDPRSSYSASPIPTTIDRNDNVIEKEKLSGGDLNGAIPFYEKPLPTEKTPPPQQQQERIDPTRKKMSKEKLPRSSRAARNTDLPVPRSQLAGILKHYSAHKISREAVDTVEAGLAKYFRNLARDMEAVCLHAGRKTIRRDDMELIMRRQKFIDENTSLNTLIDENLPMEYRDILIPIPSFSKTKQAKGKKRKRS